MPQIYSPASIVSSDPILLFVFPEKDEAIDYVQYRACFRSGQIHVLDSTGKLERTISLSEADRKL